ncbi:MAG: hypothetical protein WCF61_05495 [Terriglobales bacterium]
MEAAIASLLSHPTLPDAATNCGVAYSTLRRWLALPVFDEAYRKAREKTLDLALEQLKQGTISAVTVLLTIANDKKAPSAARVTAARTVLESAGLLKGQNVTVNNTVIPSTPEAMDQAIEGQLRESPSIREWIKKVIEKIEEEACVETPKL